MKDINLLISNGVNVQKSLELFGEMSKYDVALKVFFSTIGENLAKLQSFKETGDMAKYKVLVHSIKSEANYFGFEKLAAIAYNHEMESKANNIYFISDDFETLATEIKTIIKLVSEYLGEEIQIVEASNQSNINKEKTLLVVDDSNIIKHFVNQIFNDKYEVLFASDGQEAIDIIDTNVEIVGMLLDLNMPNVNGFAVLEYMADRTLFSKIPVCIITGIDTREVDDKVMKFPITGILKKPFSERDVKEQIEKLLRANIQ